MSPQAWCCPTPPSTHTHTLAHLEPLPAVSPADPPQMLALGEGGFRPWTGTCVCHWWDMQERKGCVGPRCCWRSALQPEGGPPLCCHTGALSRAPGSTGWRVTRGSGIATWHLVWRKAGEGWWHRSQLLGCQNDQEGLEEAKLGQPAYHNGWAECFPALSCKELQTPTHTPTLTCHRVVPTPLPCSLVCSAIRALLILESVPLRWAKQVTGFVLQQRPWRVVVSPRPPGWSPWCQLWVPLRSPQLLGS